MEQDRSGKSPRGRLVFAGMTTLDLVHKVDRLPQLGDKKAADASYFDVGGPAANAAITASILGGTAALASVLGAGPLPDHARGVLAGHLVKIDDRAGAGAQPPVASIWVDGSGERTILSTDNAKVEVDLGAKRLVPDDTAAVLIDGHYPAIARAVAAEAGAGGIPIVLDCGRWRAVYADLLPLATDIIMCATFRPPGMGAPTAEETVAAIYDRWRPQLCAVTRGADDVIAITDQGSTAIPVPQVRAIDTMGAGDVLHGGYMYERYCAGSATVAALREAVALASRSCEYPGARRGVEQTSQTRLRG